MARKERHAEELHERELKRKEEKERLEEEYRLRYEQKVSKDELLC